MTGPTCSATPPGFGSGDPAAPVDRPLRWRIGTATGGIITTIGLLLLAFAAYQVWGTGRTEAAAQAELTAQLAVRLADRGHLPDPIDAGASPGDPLDHAPTDRLDAAPEDAALIGGPPRAEPIGVVAALSPALAGSRVLTAPAEGEAFAAIRIPAIGLDKAVVGGTTRDTLRTGPGHYRGTALPGRPGNVAIAGHRTTYGAPFRDLDRLVPGDEIVLETADGVFTYRVEDQSEGGEAPIGHRIVGPDDVGVLADRGDDRVTLTACHPLYSARERIVVTAVLDGPALPPPAPSPEHVDGRAGVVPATEDVAPPAGPEVAAIARARAGTEATPDPLVADGPGPIVLDDDLGWQSTHAGPTAVWAGLTALIALAAWALGRLWRRWPAYAVAAPSFALALVTCFGHLDRLIPAA